MVLLPRAIIFALIFLFLNVIAGHDIIEKAPEKPNKKPNGGNNKVGISVCGQGLKKDFLMTTGSKQVKKLENLLVKCWQELDKMLFCTKLPMCVVRYKKKVMIGSKQVNANLIQSLTLTLHEIKEITAKLKYIKR